jgi:hypothetical protein
MVLQLLEVCGLRVSLESVEFEEAAGVREMEPPKYNFGAAR